MEVPSRSIASLLALTGCVALLALPAGSVAASGFVTCQQLIVTAECVEQPESYMAVVTPLAGKGPGQRVAMQAIGVVGGGGYPGAGIIAIDPPQPVVPVGPTVYGVVGGPASSNSDILAQASIAAGVPGVLPPYGTSVWAPGLSTCGYYPTADPRYEVYECR